MVARISLSASSKIVLVRMTKSQKTCQMMSWLPPYNLYKRLGSGQGDRLCRSSESVLCSAHGRVSVHPKSKGGCHTLTMSKVISDHILCFASISSVEQILRFASISSVEPVTLLVTKSHQLRWLTCVDAAMNMTCFCQRRPFVFRFWTGVQSTRAVQKYFRDICGW